MTSDEIDYTKYDLVELEEAQRTIDRVRFPERAVQIDILIRDRQRREEELSLPSPPHRERATSTTSSNRVVAIVIAVVVLLGVAGILILWAIGFGIKNSEWAKNAGTMIGDQSLKTVVALVELHKTRYGEYPRSLADLHFTGEWDQMHINGVSYCSNADQTAYFVDVKERGVIRAPPVSTPDEFWRGTGFDPAVGPCE